MGAAAATLARFPSWPFPLCRHGRRLTHAHMRTGTDVDCGGFMGANAMKALNASVISEARPALALACAGFGPAPLSQCLLERASGGRLRGQASERAMRADFRLPCAHARTLLSARPTHVMCTRACLPHLITRPTSTSASRSSSACACASASPAPRPRCSAARSCNARGFSRPPRHLPLGCLLDATRRVSRRSQKLPTALHSCWRAVPVPAIGSHPRCPAVTRIPPKPQT